MPRIARLIVKGEPAVYHITSRTALDGFVMKDIEKDYLLNLIRSLSQIFLAKILGFCEMRNDISIFLSVCSLGKSTMI